MCRCPAWSTRRCSSALPGGGPGHVDDAAASAGITDVVRLPTAWAWSVPRSRPPRRPRFSWGYLAPAPGRSHDSERALEEFAASRATPAGRVALRPVGTRRPRWRAPPDVPRRIPHPLCLPCRDGAVNATASVAADGKSAEIWAGTQSPTNVLSQVARLLGTERSLHRLPSAFAGRRIGCRGPEQDVVHDAVRLSKAVGKPVKVIWSRRRISLSASSAR